MTAIENGGTSNTAMKRLRELEEKNAELEKQIRIEQSHSAFKLDRKEIADFYKFALERLEISSCFEAIVSFSVSC